MPAARAPDPSRAESYTAARRFRSRRRGHRTQVLRLKRQLPAKPDSVRQLRHWAVAYAAEVCEPDDQLQADIALCVSEAASNVVNHADAAHAAHALIDLEVYHTDSRLVVQVSDEGVGMDEVELADTGLRIISELATLTIGSQPRGATVTMTFPCPTPPEA